MNNGGKNSSRNLEEFLYISELSFAAQKNDMLLRNMIYRLFPASSMVVTPHWGDYSLSDDLTSDEISATGGPQRFARYDRFD